MRVLVFVSSVAVAPLTKVKQAVNASSAVQTRSTPSASGRSGISVRQVPVAVSISPTSQRIASIAWEPKAPIQPPPKPTPASDPWVDYPDLPAFCDRRPKPVQTNGHEPFLGPPGDSLDDFK